jgi:hypothetical protein
LCGRASPFRRKSLYTTDRGCRIAGEYGGDWGGYISGGNAVSVLDTKEKAEERE